MAETCWCHNLHSFKEGVILLKQDEYYIYMAQLSLQSL